jgi:hypothetical protein
MLFNCIQFEFCVTGPSTEGFVVQYTERGTGVYCLHLQVWKDSEE